MATQATSWKAQAQAVLDVRPELEQGGEPFVRIMEAASAIKPGEMLVIVAPFEPVPLYAVLQAQGFAHEIEKVAVNEWVVCFSRREQRKQDASIRTATRVETKGGCIP